MDVVARGTEVGVEDSREASCLCVASYLSRKVVQIKIAGTNTHQITCQGPAPKFSSSHSNSNHFNNSNLSNSNSPALANKWLAGSSKLTNRRASRSASLASIVGIEQAASVRANTPIKSLMDNSSRWLAKTSKSVIFFREAVVTR